MRGDIDLKPMKYTIRQFYIRPLTRLITDVCEKVLTLFGWWKCDDCKKMMSSRTIQFNGSTMFHQKTVCSICANKKHEQRGESNA